MKIWYKWPKGYYEKQWLPWYSILRCCALIPFLLVVGLLFYVVLTLGWGLSEAEQFRKDLV